MATNNKKLKYDVDGRPIPQYFNPTTDQYEEVQGSDGASKVQLTGSNVKETILNTGSITVLAGATTLIGTIQNVTKKDEYSVFVRPNAIHQYTVYGSYKDLSGTEMTQDATTRDTVLSSASTGRRLSNRTKLKGPQLEIYIKNENVADQSYITVELYTFGGIQ